MLTNANPNHLPKKKKNKQIAHKKIDIAGKKSYKKLNFRPNPNLLLLRIDCGF